ncbi:hypothetical protein B9479_002276 [Cryptococcus floricola]|uniref:Zn(2)-C6 fungal-type domain-containing protein n=1 Tax=Cryptococcus floricola TaxID=2591691 RepID=A0A5D3AZU4_9TREE|nr:hypothetical protein B9479_002276 [Cryptococcus floricola]
MGAVTACLACRSLKSKCQRATVDETCRRCSRLGVACESIPRRLGRKLGSKNVPKDGDGKDKRSRSHDDRSSSEASSYRPTKERRLSHWQREESPAEDGSPSPESPMSDDRPTSPFSNMLNILSRVANDMPRDSKPLGAGESPSLPFDREKFLDLYRQASGTLDPDPFMGMAVLEQGLDQLFGGQEQDTDIEQGEEGIYARIDQPRRDLEPHLDPVTNGLITEREARDLLSVYWSRCHPITRILDPKIHTMDYMRATSCGLFTSVLQVAAQCLPVSQHSAGIVARLDNHIDTLYQIIARKGMQSLELCQSMLIHNTYIRANKQHQTWPNVSMSIGMALETRLEINTLPAYMFDDPIYAHISPERKRRNIQRFWLVLTDSDKKMSFIRGRRPLLRDNVIPSMLNLDKWYQEADALPCDVVSCSSYAFQNSAATLQRNIQRTMVSQSAFTFQMHMKRVDDTLNQWRKTWYNRLSRDDQIRAEHDLRATRFALLMTPYEHRLNTGDMKEIEHDECLVAGLDLCKDAIPFLGGAVRNITPGRLYLVGYVSLCTLRIMDATSKDEGGHTPDISVFHLSILSALSSRLRDIKAHPNIAVIGSVLGRRLLCACRKVAASTLGVAMDVPTPISEDALNLLGQGMPGPGATDLSGIVRGDVPESLGGIGSLGPLDLAFSFDFTHLGDINPFLENDFTDFSSIPFGSLPPAY